MVRTVGERSAIAERTHAWLRWRRLVASCRYDPATDRNLEELSERDFIITGCPRTGTSLVTAQLFRPPGIVAYMEPWDGLRMPVASLVRSLRAELEGGYMARGRLGVDALEAEGRVAWVREGERRFPVSVNPGFQLGVKWPAFWQYVPLLAETRFLVCVRDPVEVVASFAESGGRLKRGYDYDVAFNRQMNRWLRSATNDPVVRRALLWEFIHSHLLRYLDRPTVKVIHYERWFAEPGKLLEEIGDFLGVELAGSTVNIQQPLSKGDPMTRALVAEYCPSAVPLGYGG